MFAKFNFYRLIQPRNLIGKPAVITANHYQLHLDMTYRNHGAVGALLDEYERAIRELIALIEPLTVQDLTAIRDSRTKNADCRSIQTVLTHVVRAGLCYEVEIRNLQGEDGVYPERKLLATLEQYPPALMEIIERAERLFRDYPDMPLEATDPDKMIKVPWGQYYDVEQLMEHAIVHVLRHRRQIERWLVAGDI